MKLEFEEFQNMEPVSPPKHLGDQLAAVVRADLNPSAWKVFGKMSGIHAVVAAVTLSICPQFGFQVFGEGPGLSDYFMKLGHHACMVACGSFFLGSSVLVATLLLNQEEFRVVRKNRLVQFTSLALLSLGFFIMINPEILALYALLWVLGSLGGALLMTELVSLFRLKTRPA